MAGESCSAANHGRQWQQLWLTTMQGAAPLPLSFGEFDRTQARFSPDGSRIGYISNEEGNTRSGSRRLLAARELASTPSNGIT